MALVFGNGLAIGGGITISTVTVAGDQLYDTPGTYSWTAPEGVSSVCVVCIGGGGAGTRGTSPSDSLQLRRGGGGGGLGWKNNIAVTPGQTYTVVVGAGGNTLATGNIISESSSNVQIVNTGSVTFAVDSATPFVVGNQIKASPMANPDYYMLGTVTSVAVNKLSLTMNVNGQVGTGIYLGWNLYYQGEVGQAGGDSYFINQSTVAGLGGQGGINDTAGALGGGYVGDGGGTGGQGSRAPNNPLSLSGNTVYRVGGGSGGSTAGYTGNGGNAGTDGATLNPANPRFVIVPTAGAGGGAGGSWNETPTNFVPAPGAVPAANYYSYGAGSGGSGVGVYGEGASGGYWATFAQSYIMSGNATATGSNAGAVGEPGSGGGPAISGQSYPGIGNGFGAVGAFVSNSIQRGGDGGLYGGGGGSVGPVQQFDPDDRIGYGGNGAVRIIWGAGRSFPSNAAPPAFSYRSLLSPAGQSAYDSAAFNAWFEVSAQDYANVRSGISGASTIGLSDAEMAYPEAGGVGETNSVTMDQSRAFVPANNYILGLVVRPYAWPNPGSMTFQPYVGDTFRGNLYGAIGQNSLTMNNSAQGDPVYWLRKNPVRPVLTNSYVMVGEAITITDNPAGWALVANTNPGGANGAAYSSNFATWTSLPSDTNGPAQQWLLTNTVQWN